MNYCLKLGFRRCFALALALGGMAVSPCQAQTDEIEEASRTPMMHEIIVSREVKLRCPISADSERKPTEIVLDGVDIIVVKIRGREVRLEVDPGITGPLVLNPETVERLRLFGELDLVYDFGAVRVSAATSYYPVDFGCEGKQRRQIAWIGMPASSQADGVIGVHDLPYDRVTFNLGEPGPTDRVEQFELKRKDSRRFTRLGTEIDVGGRDMFAIFSLGLGPNLVSAPTADFIATHQEGAFVAESDRVVRIDFDLPRPTREMRIAYPIEVAGLALKNFAVRIEDFGSPDRVGEMEEDDPRFTPGHIVVSRRKGRGRPDMVTRIGRDQLSSCSRLTFDLENEMGYLACSVRNDNNDR